MHAREELIEQIAETLSDTSDMDVSWRQYATAIVDRLINIGTIIPCQSYVALYAIASERERHLNVEGWTAKHDDRHDDQSLIQVAASYCLMAAELPQSALDVWPYGWDKKWLKSTDPRRDLVKAASLIVAEIDRLDRLARDNEIPT